MNLLKKSYPLLIPLGLMWFIFLINTYLFGSYFNDYGLIPREFKGLIGIITQAFLHKNIYHITANSLFFILFGLILLIKHRKDFIEINLWILLCGGILLWLFGRHASHIGASLLIYGTFAYLLGKGWYDRDFISIAISLVLLYFFWYLLFGLFPVDWRVSWEGHLCGFIAGGLGAYINQSKLEKYERSKVSEQKL